MEAKNHPMEKESHLPKLHFWAQNVNLPGLIHFESPAYHRSDLEAMADGKYSMACYQNAQVKIKDKPQ